MNNITNFLNNLKSVNKLIEGILFLFLPIVVFYWSLTLLNIALVHPILSILGYFIDPIMKPIKSFLMLKVMNDGQIVDYTILLFAMFILCLALFCTVNGHILEYIQKSFDEVDKKQKEKEFLLKQEEERQDYINEINRNNTIFVTLKLIKSEAIESYLRRDDSNDPFSIGIIDSYEKSIKTCHEKFGGQSFNDLLGMTDMICSVFANQDKFLEYIPFLINKIHEINKGMMDLNVKFDYKLAAHCSYSDLNAQTDFEMTSKILNLCGNKEIYISEPLKNKLELIKNSNFKLYSRGIYFIKDKQVDVYKFQYED
jgi:hypothetical protein